MTDTRSTTPVSSDSVVERVAKAIWLAQADPEWEYIPPLLEQWGALESEFRKRAFAQATAALSTLTPARAEGFRAGVEQDIDLAPIIREHADRFWPKGEIQSHHAAWALAEAVARAAIRTLGSNDHG